MAHFYGTIKGQAGEASRLGTQRSGLETVAASWHGSVRVELFESDGVDMCRVKLEPWRGKGVERTLYVGPVDGSE